MKTKILFLTALCSMIVACAKENSSGISKQSVEECQNVIAFDTPSDLNAYAESVNGQQSVVITKAMPSVPSDFVSLWDRQVKDFYASLSDSEIADAERDGLVYEPEDDIIPDPVFAKIVNEKREVSVGGEVYRYTKNGVIIYSPKVDDKEIDAFNDDEFRSLSDKQEVVINPDVRFVRIVYNEPDIYDMVDTKAPIIEPGVNGDELILKNGIMIRGDKLRYVKYEKGSGDASGFQKTISGIFGTSVVATNYFNSKHRMKLRTFSQDFVVYTSVGMTVRMQHKRAGIWWRRKAEEFRYGWTGVECHYTYAGPAFPSGITLKNINVINQPTSYYEKPLLLFTVPLAQYKVTDQTVGKLLKNLLEKNKTRINNWLNNNPGYSGNPKSVFAADNSFNYSMIYPQYEDISKDDGREKVTWDFRVHFQVGANIGSSIQPTFSPVKDPEKIEIRRGEIYAAVKYGEWRACVISVD